MVEQVDRNAAAQCYLDLEGPPYSPRDLAEAEAHRCGHYDDSAPVLAFARHRLLGIEQGRAEMREEAAALVEDEGMTRNYAGVPVMAGTNQVLATAIRAIPTAKERG